MIASPQSLDQSLVSCRPAGGVGFYGYRYANRPITLTVATGSIDGESVRLLSAIAARLSSSSTTRIRLKVIDRGTVVGASQAFSKGEVDLAVVRGDIADLSDAVVIVTHGPDTRCSR